MESIGNKLLGEENSRLRKENGELRLRAQKAEADADNLRIDRDTWEVLATKTKAENKRLEEEKSFVVEALNFLAKNEGVTAVGIYARGKLKDLQALQGGE